MRSTSSPVTVRLLGVAGALLTAVALVACGGDDGDDADNQPAFPSPTAVATGTTAGSDIRVSMLMDLISYRYTMSISGSGGVVSGLVNAESGQFDVEGAYIKPDRQEVTLRIGDSTQKSIIVGEQIWSIVDGNVSGPEPIMEYTFRRANPLLAFWDGGPLREIIRDFDCEATPTRVNDIEARKCTLDQEGYEKVAEAWGDFLGGVIHQSYSRANAEVWVATNGYPVRMRLDVAGKDANNADFDYKLEMDLTDANASFEITAP